MARGIWKGTLGFGLVNIGVELQTAERTNELDLDMLDRRDMARIGYQKINKATGEVVPSSEIVKGMAVSKDRYVVLSDADLKAANPEATQTIEIVGFVKRDAIDCIYFAKPYYVSPLKGSERAYALLRDSLAAGEQFGIAQVVVRTRQHVCAIYPYGQALVVHLLRYHAEIRDPEEAADGATTKGKPAAKETAVAKELISSMATAWTPDDFTDHYHDDLLKLVHDRAEHGAKASHVVRARAAKEPRVLDLMAALERSVASRRGRANGRVKRRARGAQRRSA